MQLGNVPTIADDALSVEYTPSRINRMISVWLGLLPANTNPTIIENGDG